MENQALHFHGLVISEFCNIFWHFVHSFFHVLVSKVHTFLIRKSIIFFLNWEKILGLKTSNLDNPDFPYSETDSGIWLVTLFICFGSNILIHLSYSKNARSINELLIDFTKINLPAVEIQMVKNISLKVHLSKLFEACMIWILCFSFAYVQIEDSWMFIENTLSRGTLTSDFKWIFIFFIWLGQIILLASPLILGMI